MFAESIENEEILKLPKVSYSGEIKIITSEEELNVWLPRLLRSSVIGFDTETKPSFKKGQSNNVALLQLATSELALIIRIAPTGIPKLLIQVFQDPKVLKIGAAIRDDIKSLQKVKQFTPQGFIDLQNFAAEKGIENKSVRKLAAIVLNVRVSKSQQLSNWESETLTEAQLQYAAIDAWICGEIFKKMITG